MSQITLRATSTYHSFDILENPNGRPLLLKLEISPWKTTTTYNDPHTSENH